MCVYNNRKEFMQEDRRFCVYEHIRNDTNQCFYVGKGTIQRANSKIRNPHHDRIANKVGMTVRIVKDNLTEKEAFKLEHDTICHYVYDLNYGIDIIGYNNKENENGHLTNCSFGGEGSVGMVHTKEWCEQHSKQMTGSNNPMFGKNALDYMTEEARQKLKQTQSINSSGKNNPMYGISPKERMDEETYKHWYQKRVENSTGEKNPNFGNDTLHKKLLENPELKMEYYSRPGGQNGRATAIRLYDTKNDITKDFECTSYCAEWIKEQRQDIKSKTISMITSIKNATLGNKLYKNQYMFEYI